jgi:hypothetical protein
VLKKQRQTWFGWLVLHSPKKSGLMSSLHNLY